MDSNEFMTISQAAAYLNISRQQMYTRIYSAGLTKYYSVLPRTKGHRGGRIFIKKSELDEKSGQFVEAQ